MKLLKRLPRVFSTFVFADQVETPTGYEITLQKQGTYTLFGGDVETLTMDVRFETNERLHIKVNKWSLY